MINRIHNAFVVPMALLALVSTSQAETADDSARVSAETVKQQTQELLQTLKSYGAQQQEEATAATKAGLAEVDQRIDALQTRLDNSWDSMSKAAREQARASMKALREQRTETAEWYGELKATSASAWDEVKEGFSKAYLSLAEAWDDSARVIDSQTEQ